jgi:Raf kinase inhibitor-like YbhB/YbcL family protein
MVLPLMQLCLVCRLLALGLSVATASVSGEVFPLTLGSPPRAAFAPDGLEAGRWLSSQSVPTEHGTPKHPTKKKEDHMFQLTSPSFPAQGNIPSQFTCEGQDISPELTWRNAPSGVKAFALIVHDPDAPRPGGFTHWVVYDIPARVTHMAQGVPRTEKLTDGGIQGRNDFGRIGYLGPCPPSGTHRYYFYLYALDTDLKLPPGATKDELDKAMKGHVLEKAELLGKYKKSSGKVA